MSYFKGYPINAPKRREKTISEADKIFRSGDVYFISAHNTNIGNRFNLLVFGSDNKYCFEIPNISNFDIEMIYKTYNNVYSYIEMLPF